MNTSLFDALTPVKKGDSVLSVVTADRINAMQEILKELAAMKHVQASLGVSVGGSMGSMYLTGSEGKGGRSGFYKHLHPTLSGTTIKVSNGLINGGATAVTMGGVALDFDPAPTLTIGTLPYFVMLRGEWVPDVEGDSPQYTPSGIASIASFTIVGASTTMTADIAPTVNATSGAVTQNGVSHFTLAKWIDDGAGNPVISARTWGHRYFRVCHVDEAAWLKNGD